MGNYYDNNYIFIIFLILILLLLGDNGFYNKNK